MEPWYKRTFRWGQTNLTEDDPVKCDLDFWKSYWKKTQIQGVIINCGGIVSYYKSQFGNQYEACHLGEKDYFGMWNQAAREASLVVIARMDINTTSERLYLEHPDWYCVDREKHAILSQGRHVACINGGYYQTYVPVVFQEIIRRYHPDGFADNSWAGLGRKNICYCENCRSMFWEAYRLNLPKCADWNDPVYRTWIRWGYDMRVKNWEYFNEITTDAGGPDCRWFGMLSADPFDTGDRFYDIKRLIGKTDFIFCDQQSRDASSRFEQNAWNGTLLRMASNEQNLVTESMSHYYKGLKTFRLSASPEQETRKWMLSGISGGIMPWYHYVGGGTEDKRKFHTSADLFAWHKKQEAYLHNRKDCGAVGLIWNQESAIYYGRDAAVERCRLPFTGFAFVLSQAGIPFIPIHADDLSRYEERLSTIILPNTAILTEQQEEDIIRYLNLGKNLVMTGITGLLDQEGDLKGGSYKLWEYLGLQYNETKEGASGKQEDDWLNEATHNYLRLPKNRHEILDGFEETSLLPLGGEVQRVTSSKALKAICFYVHAFPIYPPEFAWIRKEEELGTIWAGTIDSGSRVVYMAADIDRCYAKYRIPDHRKLLEQSVRFTTGNQFPVTVSGPGHVNCQTYMQEDSLLIHLVNLSGCDGTTGTVTENFPVGPLEIKIKGFQLKSKAFGLVSGKQLEIFQESDGGMILLGRLEEHELIKIPVEGGNGCAQGR